MLNKVFKSIGVMAIVCVMFVAGLACIPTWEYMNDCINIGGLQLHATPGELFPYEKAQPIHEVWLENALHIVNEFVGNEITVDHEVTIERV